MRARFVDCSSMFGLLLAVCVWQCEPVRAQPPQPDGAPSSAPDATPPTDSLPPISSRRTVDPTEESVPAGQPTPDRGPGVDRQANQMAAGQSGVQLFIPKEISDIGVDIRQTEIAVPDYATEPFQALERRRPRDEAWMHRQFAWEAPEFWHGPLYFDDVQLERYGQMRHPLVQPILSGIHFFGNVPLLPYKMGIDRPCDEIATLGYYRMGDCVPPVGRWLPLEVDAAAFEAVTVIALIAILP